MAGGVPAETICAMLRWKSPRSLLEYAQLSPAEYAGIIRKSSTMAEVESVIVSHLPIYESEDVLHGLTHIASALDVAADRSLEAPDLNYEAGDDGDEY